MKGEMRAGGGVAEAGDELELGKRGEGRTRTERNWAYVACLSTCVCSLTLGLLPTLNSIECQVCIELCVWRWWVT